MLAGALVLILVLLGGAALWMRTSPPVLERAAGPVRPPAPAPVAPATPAPRAPAPASGPVDASAPASAGPALPERAASSAGAGARHVAPAPDSPPAWRTPAWSEAPAALPGRARADVRIEVATERLGQDITSYSVSLREPDGTPVTSGAEVTIRGRRADGALVEVTLGPTPRPGVYRAVLRRGEVTESRLRVASAGRIQDLPLPE